MTAAGLLGASLDRLAPIFFGEYQRVQPVALSVMMALRNIWMWILH
jgi:hypothetical protein